MSDNGFRFGDWHIEPNSNTLRSGDAVASVEPKAMEVLRYLCRHPGAVIPPEELLQACWGNAELGDNPIHKAITQLRRALGDAASDPRYIETVRKRGYRAIAPVMAAEDALEGSWQQGSPFRGLEPFQESHAAIFFGRMQATAQLRELVLNQASAGCAMALVLGPSGSGKTSLVRAGLLPGLMASRTGSGEPVALACTLYMDCADLADGNLFQALAAVLIDAEVGGALVFAGENAEGLGRWLESSDAETIAGRLAEVSGKIKIGLFVDRLEAIFRAPGVTDELRIRFIAVLEHLARSKAVLVMLACRNDFYPEVIALPALMALKSRGGHFDLNPPDGAEIAQMVRMPAKAAGLKFEVDPATGASLDDVLCDAARGSPDTLPLLQYCLDELYRQRGEDGTLRYEVFRQLGNIEGAIAVRAEQAVSAMPASQSAALPYVLSLIVDVTEEQSSVTARRVPWDALQYADAREMVKGLVDARLFVSELAGDIPCFCVSHEALLRRWPRVTEWIERHRSTLQIRSKISRDMARWQHAGRPRDLLLPKGSQVNQARDLLTMKGFSLSETEKEYILKSWNRARLTDRLKLAVMAVITGLAILATVLGFLAREAKLNAEQHRIDAEGLMAFMLGDFVDKLRPLGKLELLDDISVRAMNYFKADTTDNSSRAPNLQQARTLQVIAEVAVARGNPKKALDALGVARDILLALDKSSNVDRQFLKTLGANAFWLGQIYLDQRNFEKAQEYFHEYLLVSNRLAASDPNDVEGWIEQSYAHSNLGVVALKRDMLDRAEKEYKAAIELNERALLVQPENSKLKGDLAQAISFLASARTQAGLLSEARSLYRKEEKLLRSLIDSDSANAIWTRRLAVNVWRQGELLLTLGKNADAAKFINEAEHIFGQLVGQDPTNRTWQLRLYSLKLRRIMASDAQENDEQTFNLLSELHQNSTKLSIQDPKRLESGLLAFAVGLEQANRLLSKGEVEKAEEILTESMTFLKKFAEFDKDGYSLQFHLASGLVTKADIYRAKGENALSIQACRAAQLIFPLDGKPTSDFRVLTTQVRSFACTDELKLVEKQMEKLRKMNYADSRFMKSLPTYRKDN